MKVYMDTSGWNALYDATGGTLPSELTDREYLFSSCNLDEFCLSGSDRARELADFAWRLSNQRKLLDHVELTALEIACYQSGTRPESLFDEDPRFMEVWEHVRRNGVPPALQEQLRASMQTSKQEFRSRLRITRDLFRTVFQKFADLGLEKNWPDVLRELNAEGLVTKMLHELLEHEGLLHMLPEPGSLDQVPLEELPGTACCLEYYVALSFLAATQSGRQARPDIGDQVDFRHACYAGVADLFVTGDDRMHHVLSTMVVHRRAQVAGPEALLSNFGGNL